MSEGFWLEIEEDGHVRRVRLTGSETAIGRGDDNAIVVSDRRSSRHHCRLVVEPQGLVLEDLGSRNGTVLRGTTVSRVVVESGDEFSIGKTRFTVRDGVMPEGDAGSGEPDGEDHAVEGARETLEQTAATSPRASDPSGPPAGPPESNGDDERSSEMVVEKRAAAATGVVLECLEGDRKGEKIEIAESPFVIGRRSANALPLADQRASGEHARIVEDGDVYYVEDLGSRNGTYLGRRRVTRSLLTPDSVLQIGYSKFRVHVPRSDALARAMKGDESPEDAAVDSAVGPEVDSGGGLAGDEDLGRFEVEAFEGGTRSEHPLAVVLIVLLLGVICYFSVDVARRVLIRPPLDPPVGENDLGDNWSFEVPAPAAEGAPLDGETVPGVAVPGWKLRAGDRGVLRVSSEFAQYPGRQALHLNGEAAAGSLTRAVFERPLAVRAGAQYRIRGFVRNQGAFAAGFLVEWLREDDGETVVVSRSFSETSRETSEVLNVDQLVTAPGSVSRARFSCFALGGSGRGVFDRVVFAPRGDEPESEERERNVSTERTYRFGGQDGSRPDGGRTGRGSLSLRLRPDGTMSLARGRRVVLPRLWLGLAPAVDPEQFGSRLAALRILTEEDGGLSFVAQLPDLQDETWVTVEGSLFVAAAELTLRLRVVSGREGPEEGGEGDEICLYFEPRDPTVLLRFPSSGEEGSLGGGEIVPGAQEEMILGEKGGRVVFGFSPEAYVDHFEHPYRKGPDGNGRRVLVARSRGGELALSISKTSRLEREVTLRLVREAEDLYVAGRVGMAVELLERVPKLFPEQPVEIEMANTRIESWRQEGAAAVDDLQRDLATLRASPGPVLYGVLQSRAADVEARFDRMTPATRAAQLAGEARKFWESEAAKRREREISLIHERGRAYFLANRIGLAKLYLSRVVEFGAGTKWARQAEITLESIEKRRREHRASHLR